MSAAADAAPDVKPALSAAADAVVKPELDSAFINLIVKQQNGAVTHFRMKRDAPFKKVNHRTQSAFSYPTPPPSAAHGHVLFAPKPGRAHREVPVGRAQPAPRLNTN